MRYFSVDSCLKKADRRALYQKIIHRARKEERLFQKRGFKECG
jgi:hypothetical protein